MTPDRATEIAEAYRIARADAFVAHIGTQGEHPLPPGQWWIDAILAACKEERRAVLTDARTELDGAVNLTQARRIIELLRDRGGGDE